MNAWIIAQALLKRSLRQKYRLAFYIIIPVIGILLPFIFFQSAGRQEVKVGLIDQDHSRLSKDLSTYLQEVYGFLVEEVPLEAADRMLIEKRVHSIIQIPSNFQNTFFRGQTPQLIERGAQKGMEQQLSRWVIASYIEDLTFLWQVSQGDIETFIEYYDRFQHDQSTLQIEQLKKSKGIGNQVIGLTMVLMSMMTTTMLGGIIEDRKNKTYARILSTAAGCISYVCGQMLWLSVIGGIQIGLVAGLTQMRWLSVQVDWEILVILLGCMLIMCIAIGIGVIACCKTQEHIAIMNMFVILPSSMLTGCLLPREMMSEKMLKLGQIFPQYHLLNLTDQMQKGIGLQNLQGDFQIFFLICSIVLLGGIWRLQKQGVEKMG